MIVSPPGVHGLLGPGVSTDGPDTASPGLSPLPHPVTIHQAHHHTPLHHPRRPVPVVSICDNDVFYYGIYEKARQKVLVQPWTVAV